jgi:hypothetical protein
MRILFIGDIYGRPGRRIASSVVGEIREKEGIDFVIANGENAAGGFGLTRKVIHKLLSYEIDCITTGNHLWDKKEIIPYLLENHKEVLRPANYPPGVPGFGSYIYDGKIGVLNLIGRAFLRCVDCPFRVGMNEVKKMKKETRVIIVDFHAETTAEKQALGFYLDGEVSAVIGTHTHVQTADERILPGGTAYITDVGMTGPFNSVIGVKKEKSIQHFLDMIPQHFDTARGDERFNAVIIDVDEKTGRAISITRINTPVEG